MNANMMAIRTATAVTTRMFPLPTGAAWSRLRIAGLNMLFPIHAKDIFGRHQQRLSFKNCVTVLVDHGELNLAR